MSAVDIMVAGIAPIVCMAALLAGGILGDRLAERSRENDIQRYRRTGDPRPLD